ncbi:MAG: Ig-like domain-containing protein, partial [Anaerolineae bacterium]
MKRNQYLIPNIYALISIFLLISLFTGLLTACKSSSPTDTPGKTTPAAPTDTVAPTATAVPTATRRPLPPTNPILIERNPARGQEAAVDGAIRVRFDQVMDRPSVEAALSVSTVGDAPETVPGRVEWEDDATLRFVASEPLERAARYEVTVGEGAKSQRGLALQRAIAFSFATVGFLEVSQVIPAPDTADVAPDASLTVMFNRPVVPLMAVSDPAYGDLPQPLTVVSDDGAPVQGTGEWLNTSIYVFKPDAPLQAGQHYWGQVAAGLSDTTGGVLSEDYAWSFSVAPPTVVWTTPRNGATDIRPTAVISVTFNQSMDRASVERALRLHWGFAGGQEIAGHFRWNEESEVPDTEIGFVPDELLPLQSTFHAVVSTEALAQGSLTGLPQDYAWSFNTVLYPRVLRTDPMDGEELVSPGSGLGIYFSAPIDPKTVMPRVTILPEPTHVYTYWSSYSNHFNISYNSLPSTRYTVTVAPGISDPYGNTIDEETVVNYTTRDLNPMAHFNVPGKIGFYNGYGNTELFAMYRNVSYLDLALYTMPMDDFMRVTGLVGYDQWQAWRDYRGQEPNLLRRWVENADAERNESALAWLQLAGPEGGALPPGIYYLEMTAPELVHYEYGTSRHILVVSKTQLTLKIAQREALVWATDLQSGEPIPNLPITLSGMTVGTGADGLARFEHSQPLPVWDNRYALGGVAPYGDDFAITLSEWGEGVSPWDFSIDSRYQIEPYNVYFYTDRPIYRPGQPVYFKGIVRLDDDAHYDLPRDLRELKVEVHDDQGQRIYEETLP